MAMSDPVDGFYYLIATTDKMARSKDGKAALAASGACLITKVKTDVFPLVRYVDGDDARARRNPV
jgi:hypothetical protein